MDLEQTKQDIVTAIQQLPPSYRMVFNLFVIEGYTHDEIAVMMNISTGTSKSNLSVARSKLQRMLIDLDDKQKNSERHG